MCIPQLILLPSMLWGSYLRHFHASFELSVLLLPRDACLQYTLCRPLLGRHSSHPILVSLLTRCRPLLGRHNSEHILVSLFTHVLPPTAGRVAIPTVLGTHRRPREQRTGRDRREGKDDDCWTPQQVECGKYLLEYSSVRWKCEEFDVQTRPGEM